MSWNDIVKALVLVTATAALFVGTILGLLAGAKWLS